MNNNDPQTPCPRMHSRMVHAFTLIEVSVVLLVLAMVGGTAMGVLNVGTRQEQDKNLSHSFDIIDEALLSYRKAHDRLPCPARVNVPPTNSAYGTAGGTPGDCGGIKTGNVVIGTLPTKTLDLPDSMMLDAWGRRITYMVDERMTASNAFTRFAVDDTSVGAITVKDAAGNNRTDKAIVVLISHGLNGHGAFSRSSGALVGTNSTNQNEQENCDCDAAGASKPTNANVVQMNYQRDPDDNKNNFDDIVSYRMRFHYLSEEEAQSSKRTPKSDAPDIMIANDNLPYLTNYTLEEFSHSLSHLSLPDSTSYPSTKSNTDCMSLSKNEQYVAVTDDGGEINIYNVSSGDFIRIHNQHAGIGSLQESAFSNRNSSHYIAAVGDQPPYLKIFKREGDSVKTSFTPAGANMPSSRATAVAFSHDDTYLAVGQDGNTLLYKQDASGYSVLPNNAAGGFHPDIPDHARTVKFSPDGKWLAVGTSGAIYIYKSMPSDLFKLVHANYTIHDVNDLDFSSDSALLAAASENGDGVYLLTLNADGSLNPTPTPAMLPAGEARSVDFSGNNNYLAVAHRNAPYISIYRIVADALYKLADPASLPADSANCVVMK